MAAVLSSESNFSVLQIGNVHKSGRSGSGSGGLEQSSRRGGAVGDLVELPGAEIVDQNVEGEHVLDDGDGEVLGEEIRHSGIANGQNRDGLPAVNLAGDVGDG